jgi:hypothetical protein
MERYLMCESNTHRLNFFQIVEFGNFQTKKVLDWQQSGEIVRVLDAI